MQKTLPIDSLIYALVIITACLIPWGTIEGKKATLTINLPSSISAIAKETILVADKEKTTGQETIELNGFNSGIQIGRFKLVTWFLIPIVFFIALFAYLTKADLYPVNRRIIIALASFGIIYCLIVTILLGERGILSIGPLVAFGAFFGIIFTFPKPIKHEPTWLAEGGEYPICSYCNQEITNWQGTVLIDGDFFRNFKQILSLKVACQACSFNLKEDDEEDEKWHQLWELIWFKKNLLWLLSDLLRNLIAEKPAYHWTDEAVYDFWRLAYLAHPRLAPDPIYVEET